MKKSRLEEQKKIPKTVDYQWFEYHMEILGKRLFSSVNVTKALYGDHSVNVLTRPVFEVRTIDDLGLFFVAMIMIETIEEVPA